MNDNGSSENKPGVFAVHLNVWPFDAFDRSNTMTRPLHYSIVVAQLLTHLPKQLTLNEVC